MLHGRDDAAQHQEAAEGQYQQHGRVLLGEDAHARALRAQKAAVSEPINLTRIRSSPCGSPPSQRENKKTPTKKVGGNNKINLHYFDSVSGTTETVFLSPLPRLNVTIPAIFANSV